MHRGRAVFRYRLSSWLSWRRGGRRVGQHRASSGCRRRELWRAGRSGRHDLCFAQKSTATGSHEGRAGSLSSLGFLGSSSNFHEIWFLIQMCPISN